MSQQTIDVDGMRSHYLTVKVCPPDLKNVIQRHSDESLQTLAGADIRFVSRMAKNEIHRRKPRGPVHTCHLVSNQRRFCEACGR